MKTALKKDTLFTFPIYFFLYSVIGWIYEVFLEVVVYQWGYSDRGMLYGPYCPIYGVGAILLLFVIYPFVKDKDRKKKMALLIPVFLGCMVLATTIELAATYVCEWLTGGWMWQTYSNYAFNFQGRIALSPSIRFGLGGVVFLYVFQPVFEMITDKLNKYNKYISIGVVLIFALDIMLTLAR